MFKLIITILIFTTQLGFASSRSENLIDKIDCHLILIPSSKMQADEASKVEEFTLYRGHFTMLPPLPFLNGAVVFTDNEGSAHSRILVFIISKDEKTITASFEYNQFSDTDEYTSVHLARSNFTAKEGIDIWVTVPSAFNDEVNLKCSPKLMD